MIPASSTKKFHVYTRTGNSDSLSRPVKIAFTLTPSPSHSTKELKHYPVALAVMTFREQYEQRQTFKWNTELGFGLCSRPTRHTIQVQDFYRIVPASYFVELRSSSRNDPPLWSPARRWSGPLGQEKPAVSAVNKTTQNQFLTLGCVTEYRDFEPLVCYSLAPGFTVFAASTLMLQAYVVDGIKSKKNQLLLEGDLLRPIFPAPINTATLPQTSYWRLSENKGAISFAPYSVESLTESFIKLSDRQKAMLEQQEEVWRQQREIAQRLSATEKSLVTTKQDVSSGQQIVADICEQLSTISKSVEDGLAAAQASITQVDPRVPALEGATEKLAKSFNQTREYLLTVERYLQNTQSHLVRMDQRLPILEAKTGQLESELSETVGRTGDLATSRLLLEERLSGLDGRVVAVEAKTKDLAGGSWYSKHDETIVPRLPPTLKSPGLNFPPFPKLGP